ncbi:uncharacterized protein [Macrobrachium rosenbergii]|uniref:uncharacterized protein n=1 Tax=Macrobrachium rosenbergii TaxID=79674 RepID=UPI0034D67E6D
MAARRRTAMDHAVWLRLMVLAGMVSAFWITPAMADWDQDCPKRCKCTYVSNRKLADCRNAGFSTVPTTLSPEIQELNLANNRIEYLEKDAFKNSGLVNLQKLYLSENEIRSVDKDAFRDLKILIELDLKSNRIEKLHPKTFTGMEKLRVLDLSSNQLRRLEGVQFPELPHLRKLVFTDNKISYIHNYAFLNLHLLKSLRLSGNLLKLVQPDLFINNTELLELELHDNPWECDCHLKNLVRWVKQKSLLQEHVTCHSPERVSGRKLESIAENELACRPELVLAQTEVPVVPSQNASLTCRAIGDPLPNIKWVLNGRVLTNMSVIPYSQPEQRYVLNEVVEGGERWSQLTITNVAEHDLTFYTCVADNLAGLVEQNVSLIAAAPTTTGAISPKSTLDLYIIIAIATGGVIVLIVIITLICCCLKKRKHREHKSHTKVNGSASGSLIEHQNVMIVNPVEKPPRNYSKLPQTEVEMPTINSEAGAHTSYDDVDYPDVGPLPRQKHLPTLEEEVDDDLPSQDTTLPLESTATPSHSIIADYMGHYPDLLDMTRPRAVSPTQLSYHSLVAPQFTTPGEWRYSYVHPAEYSQYPVAYVAPQIQPRPGYVTLPRRHRSPSWAGQTTVEQESLVRPQDDGKVLFDPVYDTLGPRTTADGTSRTDLTRPTLHAAEPFTPHTPQSPNSPPLPPYYTPVSSSENSSHFQSRNHSSTLPRSTPNLLDNSGSLSLPYHDPSQIHLAQCSPTPSSASTVHAASPAYKSVAKHSQVNSKGGAPSKLPANSRDESSMNGSLHNNNLSNKSDANISDVNHGTPGPAVVVSSGKKVPPKPPPKPSGKRLSVSSNGDSKKSSVVVGESGRVFQDEGPDGTEV